jgi:NADH:ubiquinone oxidoreductase subunit 6 (subunit J)
MMNLQDTAYAIVQVVHNFGAVAIVGGAAVMLYAAPQPARTQRSLAWLVGLAWGTQVVSGMAFGAISQYYYGKFPDIHGIAVAALGIKMICAVSGLFVIAQYLRGAEKWAENRRRTAWQILFALGATALTAAAFLRWFS